MKREIETRDSDLWVEVAHSDTFRVLHPLLEKVFCLPATSAPVERILPQWFADAGKQG